MAIHQSKFSSEYSMLNGTKEALHVLLQLIESQLPSEIRQHILETTFSTTNTDTPYFPCPLKQTEAISALKAVEAGIAGCIADERYGAKPRRKHVDLERASCFLFSAYTATVAGLGKQDPDVKKLLKPTDLLKAQAIQYRRLSANLYHTKNPGEYYHIHGSLEATTTLNMIGLEGHRPDMTDYRQCLELIESHVMKFTTEELEKMNAERRQAGVPALKPDQWSATNHGKVLDNEPPFRIDRIETSSSPAGFPPSSPSPSKSPQILAGVKVLELCRIIAGPSMGRGLAEYGADVLKVTSPNLSDVPFFQVDGNLGKHTTDLDLRNPEQRQIFEALLQEADIVLDGYRPGSLERLGYGPKQLVELTKHRDRGIIYVAENCFGHVGEWAARPGWQQIADCVTGVAWLQGWSMGLDEPVVPPFPMSDYGTGCIGTVAALTAFYQRAKFGGSYHCTTSLVQYDLYLMRLGQYEPRLLDALRQMHDENFYELRHDDSVDEVGKRAIATMKRVHPELFDDRHFHEGYSRGFQAPLKFVRPVVEVEGTWNGFLRNSRPNGFDEPTWKGWEVDEDMLTV
ncbi:CoA-transferase family III [Pseudovirgaria hyperparasitica]|uniref:CoA-transferase family III n=1 Tax=Pseudovirgaria hyperparasitica TaxID=470096 RepID=A0A6A6W4X1_9PEZI|nr:CoA-transferase family III [Pseudovirgaria hyperparasitica]KAF2757922.1 CoA-transferase family III [Pseudovirgaria hyperparasitica]